jgi:hypothetical protein
MLFFFLNEMGIESVALHSRQTMNRRLAALSKFRVGKAKVLLATDVASRYTEHSRTIALLYAPLTRRLFFLFASIVEVWIFQKLTL